MAAVVTADAVPTDEINMTPLIDVMLVLLVMFIITIPLQAHAVKIDLPAKCVDCPDVNDLKNDLVITNAGAILWNGGMVTKTQLGYLLTESARRPKQPELHFQPESEARFELVDEVLAMTKRAGLTRMGFVGNERYHSF